MKYPHLILWLLVSTPVGCALTWPVPYSDGKPTAWGPQAGAPKVFSKEGHMTVKLNGCIAIVVPRRDSILAERTDTAKQLLVDIAREQASLNPHREGHSLAQQCEAWSLSVKETASKLPENQPHPRERRTPRRIPTRGPFRR